MNERPKIGMVKRPSNGGFADRCMANFDGSQHLSLSRTRWLETVADFPFLCLYLSVSGKCIQA